MKVPFFDIGRLNSTIAAQIHEAAGRALDSGWYILGKECSTFEQAMADQLAGSHVFGCNSGTDALVLSLLAAGAGAGDEIITVANTAIPTVAAICATGATPVLVDVDSETWVLNSALAASALTAKTRAVIAVHLYGNVADLSALKTALARAGRDDVAIIEDVAQAQGAILEGNCTGTIGRFGAFSFYPSKNIGALGDGGAVHCASEADAAAIRALRNYGQKDRYHAETTRGVNSRLDEVQAAILSVKLPFLESWNRRKDQLMSNYRNELAGLPIVFQKATAGCKPAWHLCVIAAETEQTRDRLQEHLTRNGVQTLIHYPVPCHQQPAFASSRHSELPVTESLAKRILSLPLSPVLTDGEQEQVIASIRSFYRQ
jgi:dTDP-4-amino-4,6-dideoxygalactose transaminase